MNDSMIKLSPKREYTFIGRRCPTNGKTVQLNKRKILLTLYLQMLSKNKVSDIFLILRYASFPEIF